MGWLTCFWSRYCSWVKLKTSALLNSNQQSHRCSNHNSIWCSKNLWPKIINGYYFYQIEDVVLTEGFKSFFHAIKRKELTQWLSIESQILRSRFLYSLLLPSDLSNLQANCCYSLKKLFHYPGKKFYLSVTTYPLKLSKHYAKDNLLR